MQKKVFFISETQKNKTFFLFSPKTKTSLMHNPDQTFIYVRQVLLPYGFYYKIGDTLHNTTRITNFWFFNAKLVILKYLDLFVYKIRFVDTLYVMWGHSNKTWHFFDILHFK